MKRLILITSLIVCVVVLVSCSIDISPSSSFPDQQYTAIYGREYWGEWKKMDQSETWLINSTSIKVNGVELSKRVTLSKPSTSVISVSDNGITYCLYAVRTATSSISGTIINGEASRALNAGYAAVVVQNINDANDKVETSSDSNGVFTADNLIVGDEYIVSVGTTNVNVKPAFDGEDIGTITLMNGVNFKVSVSNSNTVMYASNEYSIDLIIENVGDTNCSAATYVFSGDNGLSIENNYADGNLLRTVAAGETKRIPLVVSCDLFNSEYVIKKLNLEITDRNGTVWNDSVSLKFYRDSLLVNVISENGRPISGVIIGGGRTFAITNNTEYSIEVPMISERYLMVFSGAIANASNNTETTYSIGLNCSAIDKADLISKLGAGTNSFEPNDTEINASVLPYGRCIVSYLFENDIDYYCIEPIRSDELPSYKIGDVGPAGGVVFYDKGYYSNGWRYLESATSDLRVVGGVPTIDSSLNGYSSAPTGYCFGLYRPYYTCYFVNRSYIYDSSDCTRVGVGEGKENTKLLVSAMKDSASYYYSYGYYSTDEYAAKLCETLSSNNNGIDYCDWFLPSKDELNLMYVNLKERGLGNFSNENCDYWSSSENADGSAEKAYSQNFYHGGLNGAYFDRSSKNRIRPVRSF